MTFQTQKWGRRFGLCLLMFVNIVFSQNCSRGFKVTSEELNSNQSVPDFGNPADNPEVIAKGAALYESNCTACHGSLANSVKRGKSPYEINSAINTLSYMASFKSLSGEDISAISYALGYDARRPAGACKGTRAADKTAVFRLNKQEFTNSVVDLFGVATTVADEFPVDNDGLLFANNAEQLAHVSADLAEQYLKVAERVVDGVWISNKSLIMTCDVSVIAAATCAGQILDNWGPRILRRPLAATERSELLAMVTTTAGVTASVFEPGVQTMMKALLVSPSFVFRSIKSSSGSVSEIDAYELATRLSYFLWSSTVDNELLTLAKNGTLKDPAVLKTQITRMLASPKSKRFTEGFAARWFGLKGLTQKIPDPSVYPLFTPALKTAFTQETTLFFQDLLTRNLSLKNLLVADYSVLNEQLAGFYGISGVTGSNYRVVSTKATPRRGVLSHGSVMLLTSHPDDSSVVMRGKWVLNNLMCDPPPPPPAKLPINPATLDPNLTKRQKTELHRNNASCYSCHAKMDPLGFGLENFDGIGGWRADIAGQPLFNDGALPDGTKFSTPQALVSYLDTSGSFNKCATQKLTTYALGRLLEDQDDCNIDQIKIKGIESGGGIVETIQALVSSDLFMKVQGR